MTKIGIFFGTNSGTTRLVAKKLARTFGADIAAAPRNVNRTPPEEFLSYGALVLGTPTYGDGALPSASLGAPGGAWQEFLEPLKGEDFSDKTIALYGLGDQVKYGAHFVGGLAKLHEFFRSRGASIVGQWSTEGYSFSSCEAASGNVFCGLVLDSANQPLLTENRLQQWGDLVRAPLSTAAARRGLARPAE